ncbi:hypothetical protein DL764_006537 [Monosporascus ibericus]|uniref:CHAT domain-containing protein n=1 Tax=Monosporascus ibericus TaxID=155417 RepID=A0A4Q4T850_9PEZI|nr:hypothetical protein DL764_006537 [Monosporascus ibericus]
MSSAAPNSGAPSFTVPAISPCLSWASPPTQQRMASDRHHLIIQISARQHTKVRPGENSARWRVSITTGNPPSTSPRVLETPINTSEQNECRWYVEEFVTKSPYSVGRAHKVEESIREYGSSLLRNLDLAGIVNNHYPEVSNTKVSLTILVRDEEALGSSVQQHHWELLEDASLWKRDIEVTVKRVAHSIAVVDGSFETKDVTIARKDEKTGVRTINGLLVIARDLSRDLSSTDDIRPDLALHILTQLQDGMVKKKFPLRLNLQVVRPGSLSALEKHLNDTAERYGKGYFHFIHFDLHGAVLSRPPAHWLAEDPNADGSPTAYLLFNDSNLDVLKTKGEKAERAARLLGRHDIPVVVLNACESAIATAGDAVNIAKLFTQSGVKNVLAMSFKVTSSAAEVFLRAFYHNLFIKGTSFSEASRRGREAMRQYPSRQARLGLRRNLMDHFVPVMYCNGEDALFASPATVKGTKAFPLVIDPTVSSMSMDEHLLTGRDFDQLRLERQLLANRTIYVSGRPGVGKTALLQQACKTWMRTSFVEFSVYLDISEMVDYTTAITKLTSQLPLDPKSRINLGSKLCHVVSERGTDLKQFSSEFWAACSDYRRIAVVVDGLHILCIDKIDGYLARFTEGMLHVGDTKRARTTVFTIFVGRSPDVSDMAIAPDLLAELRQAHFKLRPLKLAEALELSQNEIRRAGVETAEWKEGDRNELSLLIGLLDGNPAAILHVVPQISQTKASPKELRAVVQLGVPLGAIPTKGLLNEISSLFHKLPEGQGAAVMFLGMFWIEAPPIIAFSDWITSTNIFDERTFWMAIRQLLNHGLIETDAESYNPQGTGKAPQSIWIHPLLTIFGRKAAYNALGARKVHPRQTQIPNGSSVERSFYRRLFGGQTPPKNTHSRMAALILSALGAKVDFASLSSPKVEAQCREFPLAFIEWISTFESARMMISYVEGFGYEHLHGLWAVQAPNLITCLSTCSRGILPFEKWPFDYLAIHIANIRIVGTTAQIGEVAEYFEDILQTALSTFEEEHGSPAIPLEYQENILMVITCLTVIFLNEAYNKAKYEKYLHLTLDVIEATEKKYNRLANSKALYLKGVAFRYQSQYFLSKGEGQKAKEAWDHSTRIDKQIFAAKKGSSGVGFDLSANQIATMSAELSSTMNMDQNAIADKLSAMASGVMTEGFYKMRKEFNKFFETVAEGKYGDLNDAEQQRLLGKVAYGMKKVKAGASKVGFEGVHYDLRWWPENFDLYQFSRKLDNPEARLAELEEAMVSGNSARVCRHLMAMLREATGKLEFEEVEEYVNALEKMSRNDSFSELGTINWASQREMLRATKSTLGVLGGNTGSTSTAGPLGLMNDFNTLVENAKRQIESMKQGNAPQEAIEAMEVCLDNWNKGGLAELNSATPQQRTKFSENMQKLANAVTGRLGDREFVENLSRNHLRYQRLIQQINNARTMGDQKLAVDALKSFFREPGNDVFEIGFEDPFS